MKKFLMFLVVMVMVGSASADSYVQLNSSNQNPYSFTWEPGAVTSGAAATTDLMDTRLYRTLNCQFRNPDGGSRVVTPTCYDSTGARTMYAFPAVTVASGGTADINWDPEASLTATTSIGGATNLISYPVRACPYMKVAAPAVSGIAEVSCTGYSW